MSIFLDCVYDVEDCVKRLRPLTRTLEVIRYDLLKYLCYFLCVVTTHEKHNLMTSKAIAIVFGPNIFRWIFKFFKFSLECVDI